MKKRLWIKLVYILSFIIGVVLSFFCGLRYASLIEKDKYEKKYRNVQNQVLVAGRNIDKGEFIKNEALLEIPIYRIKEYSFIKAKYKFVLIGKKANRDILKGSAFIWTDLMQYTDKNVIDKVQAKKDFDKIINYNLNTKYKDNNELLNIKK